eukprot:1737294-Amphidinium_carterae.1
MRPAGEAADVQKDAAGEWICLEGCWIKAGGAMTLFNFAIALDLNAHVSKDQFVKLAQYGCPCGPQLPQTGWTPDDGKARQKLSQSSDCASIDGLQQKSLCELMCVLARLKLWA